MSYPVSDDGNCPYCHSSDVLYIVVVSNSNQKDAQECDQNSEKTHQSPSSTNLNDGRQQSYDSQADPSSDTLHQDDNQDENNAEEDKDTTATATQDKVETSPIGSDTDEQYPDIIKSLLKLGRAYKVPEDKDAAEIPSFQCRSCGYGFNLDWSRNSLESIFKTYLDKAAESSLEESNGQNEGTPSDNVNASTYDYSTYYQYYQYYYGAHQQQSTSTTTQSDTTDGNDVEKTNEKVDADNTASTNDTATSYDATSYHDYYAYWQNYYSVMNQNVPQQQSSTSTKTTSNESQKQSKAKYTTEFKDYSVGAFFNNTTGRFQKMSDDQHWSSKGLPSDRDFRQMSHYFDPKILNEIPSCEKQKLKKRKKLSYDQVLKLKEEKKIKKHQSLMKSLLS